MIKLIYYAYVQSLLQFGIIAWGAAYKSTITPLQINQNSIIKSAMRKNKMYPTKYLYTEFQVLNIRQLYLKKLIIYTHINKATILENINHTYNTRLSSNVGITGPRLLKSCNATSSSYLSHIVFSKLPKHLTNPQCSIETFKNQLSNWLKGMDFEKIESLVRSPYI